MSHIYDNWERLVAGAIRKHQLWQLFHSQSRSPSFSSDSSSFSFCLSSSADDVPFGFWAPADDDGSDSKKDGFGDGNGGGRAPLSVLAKDQTPAAPTMSMELPVPDQNVSLVLRRRKKNLVIEVPKVNLEVLDQPCPCSSRRSPDSVRVMSPVNASRTHGNWSCDGKHQSHRLPLPPASNSAATSPSTACNSPGRAENVKSPGPKWKKGQLLGGGSYGNIYLGFNSETGEMCAMKEFMLCGDDTNSKRNIQKLEQEILLLSRLKHPNIVQYYGSEMVDEKLYVYFEYVSGGSIGKILQQYGKLGESAIRCYTQQILSGLAYLHSRNTVHRNIKADSILVDPSGCVKLANFGIAKDITRQSDPFTPAGSPYWMAPEVIRNSNGCNQAVDIWSLGCTVLEMATSRPPWSHYEKVVAMFKIIQAKEFPEIPDNLTDECKHFVRICLQWNPQHRPTASQLLEHPFVKNTTAAPLGQQILGNTSPTNSAKSMRADTARSLHQLERPAISSRGVSKPNSHYSDIYAPRNISCPVSPIGSPLIHPSSPQLLNGRISPPPFFSPPIASGSSTPSPRLTSGSSTPSIYMTSGSSTPGAGDTVTYQYHLNQQPALSQDQAFRNFPNQPGSVRTNNYWDPNILQGVLSGSHPIQEQANEYNLKQFGRATTNGILCEQSVLAERVSQRLLLTNPVKVKDTSFQFSPFSQLSPYR